MSVLSITELPAFDCAEFKVRRGVRMRAERWNITGHDVRVAERCAVNAVRCGESEFSAINKGYRTLWHGRPRDNEPETTA